MGRLSNGATLMQSEVFRNWLLVAAKTTARQVVTEAPTTADHDVRFKLAKEVLVSPQIVVDWLVSAVGTDPDVTAQPPQFNDTAEVVVQQKVDGVWTVVAQLMYPPDEPGT